MESTIIALLGLLAIIPFSVQDPSYVIIPFRILQKMGLEVKKDTSLHRRNEVAKRMNINSNSNIQVPVEIARELGLLKGGSNGGGGGGGSAPAPAPAAGGGNGGGGQNCPPGGGGGGGLGGLSSMCGKSMSEVTMNGGGTSTNFQGAPVFSVGQSAPPGEVHPDLLTLNLKGKDGKKGKDGPTGPAGEAGPPGSQGPPGPKGDTGEPCNPTRLPREKGCSPDSVSTLTQRLDKLERECVLNTTLLATITLTVVNALAQSKPMLRTNDITPPRAEVGGGGGGFGGGAGGGGAGGGGFGFGAGGGGSLPQPKPPAPNPAPAPAPGPSPSPAPAPCPVPPCPPPAPAPPPCVPPACPAPAPAPPPPPPPPCTPPACPAPAPAATSPVPDGKKGNANVASTVNISMDGKTAAGTPDCPPGKRDCISTPRTMDDNKSTSIMVNGVPIKIPIPSNFGRKKRSHEHY